MKLTKKGRKAKLYLAFIQKLKKVKGVEKKLKLQILPKKTNW